MIKEIAIHDKGEKLSDWIPLPVQQALKNLKEINKKGRMKNAFQKSFEFKTFCCDGSEC